MDTMHCACTQHSHKTIAKGERKALVQSLSNLAYEGHSNGLLSMVLPNGERLTAEEYMFRYGH